MHFIPHISSVRWSDLCLALALSVSGSTVFAAPNFATKNVIAANTTAAIESARAAEMSAAEVKTALAQIDVDLKRLAARADSAPNAELQSEAKMKCALLQERRNELEKDFTRPRYEAFLSDLKAEKERVAAWKKEMSVTEPESVAPAPGENTSVEATAEVISEYRRNSAAADKANPEAAALEKLEADIAKLGARIDAITDPVRQEALKARIRELQLQRDELERESLPQPSRYQGMVADL